jgi:hypothetical protein
MKSWVGHVTRSSSAALLLQLMLFSAFRWQSAAVEGRKNLPDGIKVRDGTGPLAETQVTEEILGPQVRELRGLCLRMSLNFGALVCAIDSAHGPKRNYTT